MPITLVGKHYEAYVTILAGEAGGPLIYIDAHGHIHVVPTSPDSRRIADELAPQLKELEGVLSTIAEKIGAAGGVGARA